MPQTITVNPLPNPITGDLTLCIGNSEDLDDTTPGGNWSSSDETVATVNSSGLVYGEGEGTSVIKYTLPGTGCFVTATVTISAFGQVNDPPDLIVCNNGTISDADITFTSSVSGTSYTWTNSQPGIGIGASGSGDINAFTAINTGTTPIVATITVTPHKSGCDGTPQHFLITINPTPTIISSPSKKICSNTAVNYDITSSVALTSFTWTATVISGTITGLSNCSSTCGTNIGQILQNTGTTSGVVRYRITPTANSCTGSEFILDVTVNPSPTLSGVTQVAAVCAGVPADINLTGLLPYNSTIYYTLGTDSYSKNQTISTTSTTFSTARPPLKDEVLQITSITINSTSCSQTFAQSATMLVNPLPTISGISATSVCVGGTSIINLAGLLSGESHQIEYSINSVAQTDKNIAADVTTFSTGPLTSLDNGRILSVTGITTGDGCSSVITPRNATLVVNTPLKPVITGDMSVCVGSAGNLYSTEAGMTNYTWTAENGTIAETAPYGNSVHITWNSAGDQTLTVAYNNSFTCAATSSNEVKVNALPLPGITGPNVVCQGTSGNIYIANTGLTGYSWSVAGGTWTTSGSDNRISVTWTTTGTVTLTGTNSAGCSDTQVFPVTVNPLPAPSIISGPLEPRINPLAYVYATQSGMSDYEWSISEGGTGVPSNEFYSVTWTTAGDHKVLVNYKQSGCKASLPHEKLIQVKLLPSLTNVHIVYNTDGDPKVGGELQVVYDAYNDGSAGSADLASFVYQWKRGAVNIGTNSPTYIATVDDKDQVLTCTVTPVSTVGPPLAGNPVVSTASAPIEDLTDPKPDAVEVCIDGIRKLDNILTGKYKYDFNKPEGISKYRWLRRDLLTHTDVPVGTDRTYKLVAADIQKDKEIIFEVTPVSSNYNPKLGEPVLSQPLAMIIDLEDEYGLNEPEFALQANVIEGYFEGPGVTSGMFSPEKAGVGPWDINYFKFYEYSNTCSQKATQKVEIHPNQAYFSPFLNPTPVFCSYSGVHTITVENMHPTATNIELYCDDILWTNETDFPGVTFISPNIIKIDPNVVKAGRHSLEFTYKVIYIPFPLARPIIYSYGIEDEYIIESVRRDTKFLGLSTVYCDNAPDQYISVEGVNPIEGQGIWEWSGDAEGDLLTEEGRISVNLKPLRGKTGNSYLIKYHYVAPLGCESNPIEETVTINGLPDADFTINPTFNIDDIGKRLIPDKPGGVFAGKGIAGDMFIPSLAGENVVNIIYSITDDNSCTNTASRTTEVRRAKGSFSGIADTLCYHNGELNISIADLPSTGTLIIKGFSNTRKTLEENTGIKTSVYSITKAGEGNDTLRFYYKWDGVDYTIKKVVNIDSLGTAIIYNLVQDQEFCDDAKPFELTVSKPGGKFFGPVEGMTFKPSLATMKDTIRYSFKNSKSRCRIDTSIYINVYKAPAIDFIPYDVCINDENDTLRFMNKTTSVDPVVIWSWEFDDEGTITKDSTKEAGYLYLKPGLQKIALSAETNQGCVVRKEKTFNIGRRPEADFYWTKDCYHPGESLSLFDATKYTTQPKSWSWRSNGAEFSTSNNAVHSKADTGFINLEYIVRTDYYQCHDTVKKAVYIRPTINLNADGYFENFEKGKGGWIIGDTSSIWSFGLPAGNEIKSAASGQNAWFTANARDGSSSIESPCYDLTAMNRPIIKLKLRKDMDKDRDGAALQYKVGDENFWHPVGTIDDGIEWYNSATINGKPGGEPVGWTTSGASDAGYKSAIHTLDELKGKKDVKFRVIYGSAGAYSDHDGIAFDDIFIGERSRHVLVEHFTSYNSSESMNYKALVDTIAEHKEGDVINIQYHTNLSGIDSLYVINPGEINARIMFYGLTRVPYTFVDGGNNTNFNMLYDYRSNPLDSNAITKRTLVNARFRLFIEPVISGRVLTVKGHVKALENVSSNNLTLFIAVTEKRNKGGFEGVARNMEFLNVFRKFIPDAAGTILKSTWSVGDSVAISEKVWTIDKSLNSSDIEIIAFLQSSETKEVYQAFSVIKPDITTGSEDQLLREGRFTVYPNPASNRITVGFSDLLKSEADIRIYNVNGRIMREYRAGAGLTEYTIENPGLKAGIYMIRVSRGILDLGYRKLIITED